MCRVSHELWARCGEYTGPRPRFQGRTKGPLAVKQLSTATVVALFAVSVSVSAQIKSNQQSTSPTPGGHTIRPIGGTYGPGGCDINGTHYAIGQAMVISVREANGHTHNVTVTCTSRGWDDGAQ